MKYVCKICNDSTDPLFTAMVLKKYNIRYFWCRNCGFLQTEEPYWLDEAYNDAINIYDTGCVSRSISLSRVATAIISSFFDRRASFVDYGGGYGLFVRLMRDLGFDFYWYDKFANNLFARGFEYTGGEAEAITCFEVFEHFLDPIEELRQMLEISRNIIFSTQILPNPIPKPHDWWYYGLEHGQHISFYSLRTLKYLAQKFNLNFLTSGSIHIFTPKKISNLTFKVICRSSRLGLHNLFRLGLKSKTLEDNIRLRGLK